MQNGVSGLSAGRRGGGEHDTPAVGNKRRRPTGQVLAEVGEQEVVSGNEAGFLKHGQ